jgi:hypothetical protein
LFSRKEKRRENKRGEEKRREEKRKWGGGERHYILGGQYYMYISSFEGSQVVPVHPSGRGNANVRN